CESFYEVNDFSSSFQIKWEIVAGCHTEVDYRTTMKKFEENNKNQKYSTNNRTELPKQEVMKIRSEDKYWLVIAHYSCLDEHLDNKKGKRVLNLSSHEFSNFYVQARPVTLHSIDEAPLWRGFEVVIIYPYFILDVLGSVGGWKLKTNVLQESDVTDACPHREDACAVIKRCDGAALHTTKTVRAKEIIGGASDLSHPSDEATGGGEKGDAWSDRRSPSSRSFHFTRSEWSNRCSSVPHAPASASERKPRYIPGGHNTLSDDRRNPRLM
ncbi:hypothetical protein C0J52_27077, partial [Blattella germanica]